MTSPKTVTPDQPQAVPDMVLVPREITQAMLDEAVLRAVQNHCHALAARPVLPVETPAEGLRKGCTGYMPDYQAGGDCVNCGRLREDHPEFAPAPLSGMTPKSWSDLLARTIGSSECGTYRCGPVAEVLYRILQLEGYDARLATGTVNGVGHVWVDTEDQRLDPTAAQFTDPVYSDVQHSQPPLSGKDGSLREALNRLELVMKKQPIAGIPDEERGNWGLHNDWRGWWLKLFMPAVVDLRAALAAVPPETAEMEGEPVAWLYRPLQAGNIPVARCKRLLDVGDSWQEIPLYTRPADRLAARAIFFGGGWR